MDDEPNEHLIELMRLHAEITQVGTPKAHRSYASPGNTSNDRVGIEMTIEEVIDYAIEHTPQANAVIAALASKGYRIVPVQPTEEQIAAGWIDKEDVNPEDIYRAMLNTAPSLIRG